jgi:hypothetical protein
MENGSLAGEPPASLPRVRLGSLILWCLVLIPIGMIPSILLATASRYIAEALGPGGYLAPLREHHPSLIYAFGVVIVSPIIETFMLAYGVRVMASAELSTRQIVFWSAIGWGLIHALQGVFWFFPAAWIFAVLTYGYCRWRQTSFWSAIAVAAVPHIANNAITHFFIAQHG